MSAFAMHVSAFAMHDSASVLMLVTMSVSGGVGRAGSGGLVLCQCGWAEGGKTAFENDSRVEESV